MATTATATKTYAPNPLPDFSRVQWASGKARGVWEPRIAAIGQHFAAAERSSVGAGIRSAALQTISPEAFPELARGAAGRGLAVTPVSIQGRPESYAASTPALSESGPYDFRVAITTHGGAGAFLEAWNNGDDDAMGMMLGYPACCREYFARTWAAGCVDPTWEMDDVRGDGPIEANILLRWLGVRAVPHMPCGFKCEGTIELGRALCTLLPDVEREWLEELLSMPMLWTSLYGIGEVTTPIVTLNFRSDKAVTIREIKRTGTGYPEAGADGIRFPFRPPPARRAPDSTTAPAEEPKTSSSGEIAREVGKNVARKIIDDAELEYQNGVADGKRSRTARWEDNGFSTLEAQEHAHGVIASILPAEERTVLDLGCGNGMLARRIANGGHTTGIEVQSDRAARAQTRLDVVICGDMFSQFSRVEKAFDVVLLMPGRFIERLMKPKQGYRAHDPRSLLSPIRVGRLLVYAYGDWLKESGLRKLCHKAGMVGDIELATHGLDVEAGIWRWK